MPCHTDVITFRRLTLNLTLLKDAYVVVAYMIVLIVFYDLCIWT